MHTILQHHARVKKCTYVIKTGQTALSDSNNSLLPCYVPFQTCDLLRTITTSTASLRTELVSNSTVSTGNPTSRSFSHPYKRKITRYYTLHRYGSPTVLDRNIRRTHLASLSGYFTPGGDTIVYSTVLDRKHSITWSSMLHTIRMGLNNTHPDSHALLMQKNKIPSSVIILNKHIKSSSALHVSTSSGHLQEANQCQSKNSLRVDHSGRPV
jgi:hypothetical protein